MDRATELATDLQLAALNNLGQMYANGQGVAQDYALAARWYLAAAGLPPSPSSPLAQAQEVGLDADIQG